MGSEFFLVGALELMRGSEDFSGFRDPESAQGVDRGFFLGGCPGGKWESDDLSTPVFDARSLQTAVNHTCGSSGSIRACNRVYGSRAVPTLVVWQKSFPPGPGP